MNPETLVPRFEAVIFDMDGLVLDSEACYVQAWKHATAEFGVHLDDPFYHDLFGRHADDVMQAFRKKIGERFDRQRFQELAAGHWQDYVYRHGIDKMPGLDEMLDTLDRLAIPYVLATNSDGPYARQCLSLARVAARFPRIVTRDEVERGKPEPDLFLEAARRMATDPVACLVLEDSLTGLLAARAAGMPAILVLNKPAPMVLKRLADFVFPSLKEVASAITNAIRPTRSTAKT